MLNISLIIPVYKESLSFLETLTSHINSGVFTEVIVVTSMLDSSSSSVELFNKLEHMKTSFSGLKIIKTASKGRAYQMNQGADSAQYNTLFFLHADTLIDKSSYALIYEDMNYSIGQNFTWGRFDLHMFHQNSIPIHKRLACLLIAKLINIRSRLTKISTGDQGLFIQRNVFFKYKGFHDMPLMEDVDLCARLKLNHPPFCSKIKIRTSSRRWIKNGIIRTILLMWKIRFMYWQGTPADQLAKMYNNAR